MNYLKVECEVEQWLDNVVIGLNLCPFASKPRKNRQIRICVSEARKDLTLMGDILDELFLLDQYSSEQLETTLIVVPEMLTDFFDYNLFIDWVEALINQNGWEGIYQVATFHPDYQFAGTEKNDDQNLTNRSPYPMFHLIREESIERVLKHHPHPGSIPDNNIARVESLSEREKSELFPYLFV